MPLYFGSGGLPDVDEREIKAGHGRRTCQIGHGDNWTGAAGLLVLRQLVPQRNGTGFTKIV